MPSMKEPRQPRVATEVDLSRWAESLAAIARTGLGFTENLYERHIVPLFLGN